MFAPWYPYSTKPRPSLELLPGAPAATYVASGQLAGSYGESATCTRATGKTCVNYDGTVFTLGNNIPAVEPQGLLIEGQHTNLCLRSQELDNATWVKTGGAGAAAPVVTANAATAPDGTVTADRVAFAAVSTAGQRSDLSQSLATSAASYTFSLWIKGATTGGTIFLLWYDGTFVTKIPVTFTTAWQRLSFTRTLLANAGSGFSLGYAKDNYDATGSAVDVDIWGVQIEQNPFVRSYVATTSTTATSNKDSVVMAVAPLPITSGYFELDFTPRWSTNAGATLFDTRDGAGNNGVAMYVQSDTLVFINGAVSFAQSAAQTWVPNQTYRLRAFFRNTTIAIYRDNAEIGGNASASMPGGHTAFRIGDGFAAASPLDGWIRNFKCGRL